MYIWKSSLIISAGIGMLLQDKAVKRFLVRNIVEQAAVRDVQEACVYDGMLCLRLGQILCKCLCSYEVQYIFYGKRNV